MELQTEVRVYNETLGVKGAKGRLIQISEAGYYEVALVMKERFHEVLLPISGTVILSAAPIPETEKIAIERF
jgi:hypothetical protein